jgi:NAD-dependent DNA ligase
MKAGFDTVAKIIKMTITDLLTVEGFKDKTATKLYDGIREKIEVVNLVILMAASNIFGRGFSEKKLELIMTSYPQVLLSKETNIQKIQKVSSIKGMAEKTAEAFIERIPDFISFIKEVGLIKKLVNTNIIQKKIDNTHPLFGKTIIITGFRDNILQEKLINFGVKIGLSVSKNTSLVLTKNIEEDTSKINEAKKIGIPIMLVNDFKMKYNI